MAGPLLRREMQPLQGGDRRHRRLLSSMGSEIPHLQPEEDAFGTMAYVLPDLLRRAMEKIGGEGQVLVVAFRTVSVESLEDCRKLLVMSDEVRIMEGLIRHRDCLRHMVSLFATPCQRAASRDA